VSQDGVTSTERNVADGVTENALPDGGFAPVVTLIGGPGTGRHRIVA
jgi:hypothetical protein